MRGNQNSSPEHQRVDQRRDSAGCPEDSNKEARISEKSQQRVTDSLKDH